MCVLEKEDFLRCFYSGAKVSKTAYICPEIRRKQVRTRVKVFKIHTARIPKRFQFAVSYPPKRNIAYKESPISFAPFRSVKTSSNHPVPEYQLPLDVREHARAKSISFEHKVQAGGHSDSASSRGNLNFHVAELLIDRFVRRTKRREKKKKKKREKEGRRRCRRE